MPSHARAVSRHSRMNLRSSALSEKLSERASAALASSIFAATVARVDLAIAPNVAFETDTQVTLVGGAILLGCAAYEAGNILGGAAGAMLALDAPRGAVTFAPAFSAARSA